MMRVTIEIVPFGDEMRANNIYEFSIANRGPLPGKLGYEESDLRRYDVWVNRPTSEEPSFEVAHRRGNGALSLTAKIVLMAKELGEPSIGTAPVGETTQ